MKNTNRDMTTGKYEQTTACDCCGKSTDEDTRMTDDEATGGGDGPGFFLCARPACAPLYQDLDLAARVALFTARRAKNQAAANKRHDAKIARLAAKAAAQ